MANVKNSNVNLNIAAILLVLALLVAIVAAVPASVLVQNSEVTSNINAANNNHNNLMTKVKRSSNDAKETMPKGATTNTANTPAASPSSLAGMNKKSSPEVLPPAFSAPAHAASMPQSAAASSAMGNNAASPFPDGNRAVGVVSLPTSGEIINSAIAAGLTAAAVEAAAAASQRELEQQQQLEQQAQQLYGDEEVQPTLLHKRGINAQQYPYLYGGAALGGGYGSYGNAEYYNNPYLVGQSVGGGAGLAAVPNGVWADEMDPAVVYTDLQDLQDEYLPAPRVSTYRNKAYDNLQNILNAETYLEPMALAQTPQSPYTSRYYGAVDADSNKRTNRYNNGGNQISATNRFTDMRLKRDTKLTPADMLALVALVEAGERARKDPDTDTSSTNNYMYPAAPAAATANLAEIPYGNNNNYNGVKSYYPNVYDYPVVGDELEENGAWLEPNVVDYYGVPMNMETMPKYEVQRELKYATSGNAGAGFGNRYGGKRYMVAKKKRSVGKFLNEPVANPSINYQRNGEQYF